MKTGVIFACVILASNLAADAPSRMASSYPSHTTAI